MPQEQFSSRERVIRTLNREPVDRFPIDMGSHFATGINAFAYHNLRRWLELPTEHIQVPDIVQFLARVDEDVLERFHCDLVLLHVGWPTVTSWNPREAYRFDIPAKARPRRDLEQNWVIEQRQADNRLWSMTMAADGFRFYGDPVSDWFGLDAEQLLKATAREARRIHAETPFAITYVAPLPPLFGGRKGAAAIKADPEAGMARNAALCREYIRHLSKAIDLMGGHVQVLGIAEDFTMPTDIEDGSKLVEMYYAPYLDTITSFVHGNTDWKIFLHARGATRPTIRTLADCGIDALNPMQRNAGDLNPAALKNLFGDRLVLWGGGCDTAHVLPHNPPDLVREHVEGLVDILKPGGGFVFSSMHNIPGDTLPQNIATMLDTAYANSFYVQA